MTGGEDSPLLADEDSRPDTSGFYGKFIVFSAVFCVCLIGFGTYFCFDNPAALEKEFRDVFNIDATKFEYLYGIYAWPNCIIPMLGGYFADRFGVEKVAIIFSVIVLAGKDVHVRS